MSVYTLTEITARPGRLPPLIAALSEGWERGLPGGLLGVWTVDLGVLNRVVILSEDGAATLPLSDATASEAQVVHSRWRGLPGQSILPPGAHGPCYELRCYDVLPDHAETVSAAFRAALPQRVDLSPLLIAMESIEGPPRFAHIWPYASLDSRQAIRADAAGRKIWPPPVSGSLAGRMTAEIMWPVAFSPLR